MTYVKNSVVLITLEEFRILKYLGGFFSMKPRKFIKVFCVLLICSQLLMGGLAVYASDDVSGYVDVSPINIGSPRPVGKL